MKLRTALIPVAAIVAALAAFGPAVPATAAVTAPTTARPIVISEIYYNSPGPDHGSNASLNDEWVQLHNTTGHAISLTGWKLRDAVDHTFTFGSYELGAHAYVKIHTGHGRRTQADRYWNQSWYIWNNTGDRATLRTGSGTFQDRCTYSDPDETRAYTTC